MIFISFRLTLLLNKFVNLTRIVVYAQVPLEILLFRPANSVTEADQALGTGSADVDSTFEFSRRGNGGGGLEKSIACKGCVAKPWKGGSSSRLRDPKSSVVASLF